MYHCDVATLARRLLDFDPSEVSRALADLDDTDRVAIETQMALVRSGLEAAKRDFDQMVADHQEGEAKAQARAARFAEEWAIKRQAPPLELIRVSQHEERPARKRRSRPRLVGEIFPVWVSEAYTERSSFWMPTWMTDDGVNAEIWDEFGTGLSAAPTLEMYDMTT